MQQILNVVKQGDCFGCSACAGICTNGSIRMQVDEEGFSHPIIDETTCTKCNRCEQVCIALEDKPIDHKIEQAYAAWAINDNLRYLSSSGGVLSVLAQAVLDGGGTVYGAIFDPATQKVRYSSSDNAPFAWQRKSKYVEADLEGSFAEIKKELQEGRQVLFSGTPCYVSGLKKYLGRSFDNLLTSDFICHGRPSTRLFEAHLCYLEELYGARITQIDFRPKIFGWKKLLHLEVTLENGRKKRRYHASDFYFDCFYQNKSLRRSCMRCRFSTQPHHADLTLADYWEYFKNKAVPNDNQGISLVLCNTPKGAKIMANIKSQLAIFALQATDYAYVFHSRNEKNYSISARTSFFRDLKNIEYNKLVRLQWQTISLTEKIKLALRGLVIKIFAKYIQLLSIRRNQ